MQLISLLRTMRPSLARRYALQCFFIFKQGGTAALVHRITTKLRGNYSKPSVGFVPRSYNIASSVGALRFPACQDPLVSIIIPFYNAPLFTYSCLKSVLDSTQQTVPYEVILVDDRSDCSETLKMVGEIENVTIIRNERNLGFVGSCNSAAQRAKGKYLLFLNNDTLVTPGWLHMLIQTFTSFPDAGMVGCKLLYPDGTLQEAGGIVWKDGSAWNYGRNDDPGRPEYSYLREVDYCSGACIMVPRSDFETLNGFDSLYSPAYYEDTDLAFRIRDAGKTVLYQPLSEIIHFEGITSGRDISQGPKKYQEINRQKFYDRWRHQLSTHGYNGYEPGLEKDRYCKKRMLVVDARMVKPDRDSGSVRMYHILMLLKKIGFKVTFAAANLTAPAPYAGELQANGIEVLYAPYVTSWDTYIPQKGADFDVVWLSRADLADMLMGTVKRHCTKAVVIFDTVDLHFIRESRMAVIEKSASLKYMALERKKQELSLVAASDATIVVSPEEKSALESEMPAARIEVISNIHEVHDTQRGFEERKNLFFVGGFEHPPNIDAVEYYITQIAPQLRLRLPGVKTYIIGSDPPPSIRKRGSDDIIIKGYVKDIDPYLSGCRMLVAPIRFGAGVKGKINLGMSYGVPVVTTSIGAEGMGLVDKENVMVGDEPQQFTEAIAEAYENPSLWERLSENGKKIIQQRFSPDVARRTLERLLAGE